MADSNVRFPHVLSLLVLLLATCWIDCANGQASFIPPTEEIFEESFDVTCSELLFEYDWSGDCCSFRDNNDSNGCDLTISNGNCTQDGRTYQCGAPPENTFMLECVGPSQVGRGSLAEDECPASDYELPVPSENDILSGLTLTVTGISSLDEEGWVGVTENHTFEYGVDHDLTGYMGGGGPYVNETRSTENELVLEFFHFLSWRPTLEEGSGVVDPMSFLVAAFNSPDGKAAYLEKLQELAPGITAVSDVTVMANPDDCKDEPATAPSGNGSRQMAFGSFAISVLFVWFA